MSRKGKLPISIPKGVEVKTDNEKIHVKGPKGQLSSHLRPEIVVQIETESINVSLHEDYKEKRNFHGLFRTLIYNLVMGVSEGFSKKLEMRGVGYRAAVQGNLLNLQIGVSHDVKLPIPDGIKVEIEKNVTITISGIDKQVVGQFAAQIRSMRPPEPFKGKGIRYVGEYVRKKAGKSAAKK